MRRAESGLILAGLLLLGGAIPSAAKRKPAPLGGDCTEILTQDDFNPASYTGQPRAQAVFGFADAGGEGEATLRGEFQCPSTRHSAASPGAEPPSALCTDLLIKRPDGRQYRVAVSFDDISEFDRYEAVHLRPNQDSIFVIAHPVIDGPEFESEHWLAVLNVPACEWVGVLIDYHAKSLAWPTTVKSLNVEDPQFKAEADFLNQAKAKEGYFTPEMIEKVRMNDANSKWVWLLDNPTLASGQTQGTLKLQWYPWDAAACAPEAPDHVQGTQRLKGTTSLRLCNETTHRWAWLFLPTEYEEDQSTSPVIVAGSQIVVQTSARHLVIQLDTRAWTQEASVKAKPAESLPAVPVQPVISTAPVSSAPVPAVSSSPAVSTVTPAPTAIQAPPLAAAAPSSPPSALDDVVMQEENGGSVAELEDNSLLDQLLGLRTRVRVSSATVAVSTGSATVALPVTPVLIPAVTLSSGPAPSFAAPVSSAVAVSTPTAAAIPAAVPVVPALPAVALDSSTVEPPELLTQDSSLMDRLLAIHPSEKPKK